MTCVVAMFVPKWLPRMRTESPPLGEPAIGLSEEMLILWATQKYVNVTGAVWPAAATITTFTVSGTREFLSAWAGVVTVIDVALTAVIAPFA